MPLPIKLGFICKMRKVDKEFLHDDEVMEWKDFVSSAKRIKGDVTCKKDANSLGLLAHTGGTTGFPKSVILSDNALNAVACQYKLCMEHNRGEVFLNAIVPFVVYGILTCMHMPLCLGLCVAIIPKFEAANWINYIKKYHPNHIASIPSYVEPMLNVEKFMDADMSCVKTLAVGGDGMNEKLENELNLFLQKHQSKAKILKGYGMTEVCATAVTCYKNINKAGSVGIPLVKNNVLIYDNEQREECRYNGKGEVCLSCASTMIEYRNNEKEMNNLIKKHENGENWIHTGDLGYVDEDGFLFLVGRMKRMMILGPEGMKYKVYPQMIEEQISKVNEVQAVCVVSVETKKNSVVKAYVVVKEYCEKTVEVEKKIRKMCDEELSDYMRPQYYEFLDELPLTAAGKVDYKALEE